MHRLAVQCEGIPDMTKQGLWNMYTHHTKTRRFLAYVTYLPYLCELSQFCPVPELRRPVFDNPF